MDTAWQTTQQKRWKNAYFRLVNRAMQAVFQAAGGLRLYWRLKQDESTGDDLVRYSIAGGSNDLVVVVAMPYAVVNIKI